LELQKTTVHLHGLVAYGEAGESRQENDCFRAHRPISRSHLSSGAGWMFCLGLPFFGPDNDMEE